MTSGDVKLCIVCDSAISANVFAVLAMQVIQPMVLRLQDKHAGSKLTVGIVTYTTPTTRPAIVARRAFTQAGALFPLFREAPHSIGIGTSGSGGPIGMAILEGLVAAIEMCDDVLEAPARRQRMRHPSIPAPPSATPIFHVLLIGGSRPDHARRPFCNASAALDDTTWDTLPDELKKLWPTPDPVWFPKPKNYTILLAGTHMANAKRQLEAPASGPALATASKRAKNDSPKPSARPIPPKIELPAPTFSPPPPAPAPAPATVPATAPAPATVPAPAPAPVPHPPSIPQPPQIPQQPKIEPPLVTSYRQLRNVMINPTTSPEQRLKLSQSGFRMDEQGAFVGGAGVIFDTKGQPGPGAAFSLKVHHDRWKQIQLMKASAAGHPAAQQALRMMIQQQQQHQQQQQAMGAGGSGQAPGPSQAMGGQSLNPNQSPLQPESNPSPTHHRSPSHTQAQPPDVQAHAMSQGHAFQDGLGQQAFNPMGASPAHQPGGTPHVPPGGTPHMQPGAPPAQHGVAGTPQQTGTPQHPISISTPHASTPQHIGMSPPQGTPQLAHSTPKFAHATPQMQSTPQMTHSTPQMTHSTPQMTHSTPQMVQTPQMAHTIPQAQDQGMAAGQQQSPPNMQGMPGSAQGVPGAAQGMPGGAPNPGGQTLGDLGGAMGNNTATPASTSNVWRGQVVYLFQQRPDQEPASLHFSVVAAGAPGKSIETHRWPTRLDRTNGFKQLPAGAGAHLYNTPVPFGQISINPEHAGTDLQKWQVFQRIVSTGWTIFYEFPPDPTLNPNQGPRGVFFFAAPQAPGRVLFKAFINQPCPPILVRGGQPAGPTLTRAPPNPAAGGNPAQPPPVQAPAAVPNPPVPVAPSISPAPGVGTVPGVPGAAGAPPTMPGAGMVPGAGVSGIPGRPNPAPNPPNANPNPVPPTIPGAGLPGAGLPGAGLPGAGISGVGINPAMMQGLNPAVAAMNAANAMNAASAMNGVNQAATGIPGAAGLNPSMIPGLNPAAVAAAAAAGVNPAAQTQFSRLLSQMALARLGLTPAQLSAAPQQQKQMILAQVQQLVPRIRQQIQMQQNAAGNMGVGMPQRAGPQQGIPGQPGGMPGQPGLEHLQQFIRSQQQQHQQQQQRQG